MSGSYNYGEFDPSGYCNYKNILNFNHEYVVNLADTILFHGPAGNPARTLLTYIPLFKVVVLFEVAALNL